MNTIIKNLFVATGCQLPEIKENEMFFIIYMTFTRVFFSIVTQDILDEGKEKLIDGFLPAALLSQSTFILTDEKMEEGGNKYSIIQVQDSDLETSGLLDNEIPTVDQRVFSRIEDIILYAEELSLQGIIETLKSTISEQQDDDTDEAKDALLLLPINTRVHGLLKHYRESDEREVKDAYINALEKILSEIKTPMPT